MIPFIPTRLNDLYGDVLLTSAARGDLLYRGASKWQNLAAGTSGHALTSNGAGADPSWQAIPSPDLTAYALLAGRAGGQTLIGGTGASENLTLRGTSHGTPGSVVALGTLAARLIGGTSSQQVEVSHDGASGFVKSKDGYLQFFAHNAAGGFLYGDNATAVVPSILKSNNLTYLNYAYVTEVLGFNSSFGTNPDAVFYRAAAGVIGIATAFDKTGVGSLITSRIDGVDGSGANASGSNVYIAPGQPTGNKDVDGEAGAWLQSPMPGSSGSVAQTLYNTLGVERGIAKVRWADASAVAGTHEIQISQTTHGLIENKNGNLTIKTPGTILDLYVNSGLALRLGSDGVTANARVFGTYQADNGYTFGSSGDTALSRNAAGVVEINNGTPGTYRDLLARTLISRFPTGTADIDEVRLYDDGTQAILKSMNNRWQLQDAAGNVRLEYGSDLISVGGSTNFRVNSGIVVFGGVADVYMQDGCQLLFDAGSGASAGVVGNAAYITPTDGSTGAGHLRFRSGGTIGGTPGSGSNDEGDPYYIDVPVSTGNATPGSVVVRSTVAGSSGTTPQTLAATLVVENGITKVRQYGGTAGTHETQIRHNGTDGVIESKEGSLRLIPGPGGYGVLIDGGIFRNNISAYVFQDNAGGVFATLASDHLKFGGAGPDSGLIRNAAATISPTDGGAGAGHLQFREAGNLIVGTTTGTKFGTATTQKMGWWDATPVVQPAGIADSAEDLAEVVTKFNSLLAKLETIGLLAVA